MTTLRHTLTTVLLLSTAMLPLGSASAKDKLKEWLDVDPSTAVINMSLPGLNMQPFTVQKMLINRRGFVYHKTLFAQNGEKYPTAQFYIQDLGSADQVFIRRPGESDSPADRVRELVSDATSVGDANRSKNRYGTLSYVHYMSEGQGPCLYIRQYGGSDGAGDVTSGGEALGSRMLEGHLCLGKSETNAVDSQLTKIFLDSFTTDME